MKIERITHNKIKITLSNEDLIKWDINVHELSGNTKEAKEVFWELIKQAEDETGFFVDGSQLVVEAMSKQDSFVMFITRIDDADENSLQRYIRPKAKSKKRKLATNPLVFKFTNINDVASACKHIENRFVGVSSLYKQNEIYYLVLNVINDFLADDLDIILTEFGEKIENASLKESELLEYGTVLIDDNTVGAMASFF